MIRSVIPFDTLLEKNYSHAALKRFLKALEQATGLEFVADSRRLAFAYADLQDLASLYKTLHERGIVLSLASITRRLPDDPPLYAWHAAFTQNDILAGGSSFVSNHDALIACLAECLERHIWRFDATYFKKKFSATIDAMRLRSDALMPARFAGFSGEQRSVHAGLRLRPDSNFLWIQGYDHSAGIPVYLPAQVVTGLPARSWGNGEPLIRPLVTTGLATALNRTRALLGGALEVIERDAYMIMWLNQLTLPRIDLDDLARHDAAFARLLVSFRKYRLELDVIKLLTDAPAHAVCAVLRDASSEGIPVVLGLSAGTRLIDATEHAIKEALRIRLNIRDYWKPRSDFSTIQRETLGHQQRLLYWLHDDRHMLLNFMTAGPLEKFTPAEWENDTDAQHWSRVVTWCAQRGYACTSVDLGRSKRNPTSLAIEMVVIPELQPMHLHENLPAVDGKRLTEVPTMFGYNSLPTPYLAEPHPFL